MYDTQMTPNDRGALASLTFNGGVYERGVWKEGDPVTISTAMTEADFSGAGMGESGAIILAAWLQHKVLSHSIRHEQP